MVEVIVKIVGVGMYLYLSWRNLRQDYQPESLVGYGWLSVGFFAAGSIGGNYLLGYFFWLLLSWWWCRRWGWKLWRFLEDMSGQIMVMLGIWLAGELVGGRRMESLIYGAIVLGGLIFLRQIKGEYRSFFWYRSGKKGFVFWAVNWLIFTLLAIYWFWERKWLWGNLAIILSLISVGGLVILGDVFRPLRIRQRRIK